MLFYLQTDFLPGWRPMQNYGHTLDSGCSKPWGTEQQELVRSLGAPGGDEHRCRLAAPRSQGLVGALLKFQGLRRMPPALPARPPMGTPRQQQPC